MAVDGCGLVCKYIIIAFDCIFAVLGLALAGLGLWLRFSDSSRAIFEIEDLNSSTFVFVVIMMIALGVWMLIIVSFGDFGACSEHRCSLQVFSCLVTILTGASVVMGVLAYMYRSELAARAVEFYVTLYTLFKTSGDPVMGQALTFLHKLLHCCGVTGFRLEDISDKTCPGPKNLWQVFAMTSCPSEIVSVFEEQALSVLGVFLGIGALLILLLICSLALTQAIRAAATSPQYILLGPTPPCMNPQPPLPAFPNSDSAQNQEPVVFTPLTAANIPLEPV